MSTIPASIRIPDNIVPLIEDAATEAGESVEIFVGDVVSNGQSIQGIASDRLNQAWWRLQQAGTIPAEVLAESRRHAEANAPKKDPAPGASA